MEYKNTERFSGFSDIYHRARPVPPEKVCKIILGYLGMSKAKTVVDLGSGTGLSTGIWLDHAKTVTGIEPNDDMRAKAAKKYKAFSFSGARAEKTGLPADSVNVITCSQSFHWMDPVAVLREADRLLTDRGVFAAYDCQWPVSIGSLAEKAWISLFDSVLQLSEKYKYKLPLVKLCPKSRHLQNMENSKVFTYCRQVFFDAAESCTADRFINMALSQGSLQMLLRHGIHEIDREFEKFRDTVRADITKRKQMTVSYVMVLGQKLQSLQV